MIHSRARRAAALTIVVSPLLALAACGGTQPEPSAAPSSAPAPTTTPSATPTPTAPPKPVTVADSLDGITVSGAQNEPPQVKVPAPWAIKQTQAKVLRPGTGPAASADGSVSVRYVGINGRTGDVFDSSYQRGAEPVTFPLSQVVPGFKKGLTGQKAGSRVLIAMTPADGYGPQGGNPQAGIEKDDSLVFVVDIDAVSLDTAAGKAVAPPPGTPAVTEKNGRLSIARPTGEPPSATKASVLIEGTGREIKDSDTVTMTYTGITWDGKEVDHGQKEQTALEPLIDGLRTSLVGKKVGSRVLVEMPPKDAFGAGSQNPAVPANTPVVYAVDLLWAEAPQAQPGG